MDSTESAPLQPSPTGSLSRILVIFPDSNIESQAGQQIDLDKPVTSINIPSGSYFRFYDVYDGCRFAIGPLFSGGHCIEALSPEKAKDLSAGYAEGIFRAWYWMRDVFAKHEATIRRRWLRKTRENRRKILLEVWPEMSLSHRPDFEALYQQQTLKKSNLENESAFLWPQINTEDLSNSQSLLLFLDSRARHPPEAFAIADDLTAGLAKRQNGVPLYMVPGHIMSFAGSTAPRNLYGRIVTDHEGTRQELLRRGLVVGAGHGVLVLKTQRRIYEFLASCCKHILHDIIPEDLEETKLPLPAPSTQTSGYGSQITFQAATAADAAYRLPSDLDLVRMLDLVAAKQSAAEDHLLALREDPAYFAEKVSDMKEHDFGFIRDAQGRLGAYVWPSVKPGAWGMQVHKVIYDAYKTLEEWADIHKQISSLHDWNKNTRQTFQVFDRYLPDSIFAAFQRLYVQLVLHARSHISLFFALLAGSPPWRSAFTRIAVVPGDPASPQRTQIDFKGINSSDKLRSRLSVIIRALQNENLGSTYGFDTLMDELGRLIESEPQCEMYLTNLVLSRISDMAVIAECCHQLSLFQPFSTKFCNLTQEDHIKIRGELSNALNAWDWMRHKHNIVELGELGAPIQGRFHYPVGKAHTRANNELMCKAEENLERVWRISDHCPEHVRLLCERTTHVARLLEDHPARRTPEWEKPEVVETPKPSEDQDAVPNLAYELGFQQPTESREKVQSPPKEKIKTRGVPQPAQSTSTPPAPAPAPSIGEPSSNTIAVHKRVHKIFSAIFHDSSGNSQPGEIPWSELLYAMTSMGFAAEKLYGSAWQFSPAPEKLDLGRSIQFHEPHPSKKLSFREAKRVGNRLNRAYGWDATTFVLIEPAQ